MTRTIRRKTLPASDRGSGLAAHAFSRFYKAIRSSRGPNAREPPVQLFEGGLAFFDGPALVAWAFRIRPGRDDGRWHGNSDDQQMRAIQRPDEQRRRPQLRLRIPRRWRSICGKRSLVFGHFAGRFKCWPYCAGLLFSNSTKHKFSDQILGPFHHVADGRCVCLTRHIRRGNDQPKPACKQD